MPVLLPSLWGRGRGPERRTTSAAWESRGKGKKECVSPTAETLGDDFMVRVLIATRPVDLRRGADGLAATVQSVLRQDPFCGTVFVFRSKRADRVKMLVYDGTGL